MSRRASVTAMATLFMAAVAGLAGGWLLARGHHHAHREALFAGSAWRRHAALGWLERHGDSEALPLLRDYLAWERQSALQSRARRVISWLEAAA
jgi:hypothetical protein